LGPVELELPKLRALHVHEVAHGHLLLVLVKLLHLWNHVRLVWGAQVVVLGGARACHADRGPDILADVFSGGHHLLVALLLLNLLCLLGEAPLLITVDYLVEDVRELLLEPMLALVGLLVLGQLIHIPRPLNAISIIDQVQRHIHRLYILDKIIVVLAVAGLRSGP
jgi:hypothetical protein